MLKFLKIICFFLLTLIPLFLAVWGLKHFYPVEYSAIETKTKINMTNKFPFLKSYLLAEKKIEPKKEIKEAPKIEEKIEEPKDFLTNKDVYEEICEAAPPKNLLDKFIGCQRCPKSLNAQNPDYFSVRSHALGAVVKKAETEAAFFMNGCASEGQSNGSVMVLRKGFGGWKKLVSFKEINFEETPLAFKDDDGVLLFVGKMKLDKDTYQKEILSIVNFKESKFHKKEIFSAHFSKGISCHSQFLSAMANPEKKDEKNFFVELDVLGWEETEPGDCKIFHKNKKTLLSPGDYKMNFSQHNDTFKPDLATQKIMTQLEIMEE